MTSTTTEVDGGVLVELELNPVPASRPRHRTIRTKTGKQFTTTYYAGNYKEWMKAAEKHIAPAPSEAQPGHYTVDLLFVVHRPKTTKLTRPKGDIDNYAKAMLDVLTRRGYWPDDMDIVKVRASKRFAEPSEEPYASAFIRRADP